MEQMLDELAAYYETMGYPLYAREELEQYTDEELRNLYELTFPKRDEEGSI